MIRRDIQPQWEKIVAWYWEQYDKSGMPYTCPTIWDILERDHGAARTRPMGHPSWSVMAFPDESSYAFFLLRWS